MVLGMYTAFGKYYRFAAADAAEVDFRAKAISLTLASMLFYGIMNLFMTSTPLAMRAHDHHFNEAAFVLQWHMIGMYGSSFFTGSLLQQSGWRAVNYGSIPFLILSAGATLWLMWRRRA